MQQLIKKGSEIWIARTADAGEPTESDRLTRFVFSDKENEFVGEDITLPKSTHSLSGFTPRFALGDLDGDGLDEIVVSETTGRLGPVDPNNTEYGPEILDRKEYLHVLKWDGKNYRLIWTSPPFLGNEWVSRILIADITGDRKPEIIVATSKGTLHIFEKK